MSEVDYGKGSPLSVIWEFRKISRVRRFGSNGNYSAPNHKIYYA